MTKYQKILLAALLGIFFGWIVARLLPARATYQPRPVCSPSPTPDPSPTETPTPTPTVSPTEAPKGESRPQEPQPDGSVSQPTCDIQKPNRPEFLSIDSGILGDGKLKIRWPHVLNATHVNIIYREYTRGFEHGVANWPNNGEIEIGSLKNVNYEFCVQGMNRCATSDWTCIDPLP